MPDFNSPNDYEWGGADPRGYESGDGTWFYSALEKSGGSGGDLTLIVFHVAADGTIIDRWAGSGIMAQGGLILQPNGRLDACGFVAVGDNKTRRVVPVPGWIAWPLTRGPAGPKGDTGPAGPPGAGSVLAEALRKALKAYLNAP